ncbi:MAG: DUF2238 domain-containing protein [Planctomycetes bacterium]|nr:DUF2238 domain-containing protein [Planctomycetota bacterium]
MHGVKTGHALLLLALVTLGLAISAIEPFDRTTWWLEIAPVLLAAAVMGATWRRFPLTPLVTLLIALHAGILMLGGHYTYARVPLGDWVRDAFELQRNPYDRLGHFAQGFVPALVAREILLRTSPLRPGKWLAFLVACVALAISACYEFVEWWSAVIGGAAAEDFLGTQGDPWDTQWDMFLALLGAVAAQLGLARTQDRQIAALREPERVP